MLSKISGKAFIVFVVTVFLSLLVGSALAAPVTYIYDELNRLREVHYPDNTVIKYEYDKLGNRTSMETSGTPHLFIAATAGANGIISPSGDLTVTYGASQTFTMVPSPGHLLLDVVVDHVSLGAVSSYTFDNITAPHAIRAVYSNTLTIAKTGSGTGTITSAPAGINCGTTCSAAFAPGGVVTLTAIADTNSIFSGWSGGGCSGTGSCTVTLNSDTTVNALFINSPPTANFSATPTTGLKTVTANFSDLSTENPTSWLWDFGDSLSSSPTSTLKNPNHTYSSAGNYTVTLTSTNAGGSNTLTKTAYIVVQPYLKIAGSAAVYRSIQEAYTAASDGATIQVRDLSLAENFTAISNPSKSVTVNGGCITDYSSCTGTTSLKGTITINTGRVTIKNIILQK
jgi:YD repeat-containing protein